MSFGRERKGVFGRERHQTQHYEAAKRAGQKSKVKRQMANVKSDGILLFDPALRDDLHFDRPPSARVRLGALIVGRFRPRSRFRFRHTTHGAEPYGTCSEAHKFAAAE